MHFFFKGWVLGVFDRMVMNFAVVTISKGMSLTATQTGLTGMITGFAAMLAVRFAFG